ncbi:MAG: phenylalanine--tRNA ligase subunit beta [Alphaproteobacteria bacterium]
MKFTLDWLKEHLDTDADLKAVTDKLTAVGLELEEIEQSPLAPFVVAKVISAEQHPNADKLRVCKVDPGDGTIYNVVCGAPNARTGLVSVFAPVGTYIPGKDFTLELGSIRGERSEGMLCSEKELLISEDHDGIVELPEDAPVGMAYIDYRDINDPVIEINVTPNRADCLGVRGVARDLAAAKIGTLKDNRPVYQGGSGASPVSVEIETENCPIFTYRIVRNVKNGESPDWLKRKLEAIGQKPISALVDITNWMTLDQNRPMHVFDADKIAGGALTVRQAQDGESMMALNDKEYSFDPEMVVIADSDRVVSLGGIIGGAETGCSEDTVNVLVEAALWNPSNIARTGRKLGVHTDARFRFERGTDSASAVEGLEIATQYILDFCGGEPGEIHVTGEEPAWQKSIDFDFGLIERRGGMAVDKVTATAILEDLGFKVSGATVQIPSWRPDIDGQADLVEEVLRIIGLDALPTTPFTRPDNMPAVALSTHQRAMGDLKRALAAEGMDEAVLWSFTSSDVARHFGWDADSQSDLLLANPISADLDVMRPSLLPNLIMAASRNNDRGYGDVALFEAGLRFLSTKPDGQLPTVGGVRMGSAQPRHWAGGTRAVDAFDAKSDALAALEAFGAPVDNLMTDTRDIPGWFHPGRSGTLGLGKNTLAVFGELHPKALRALGIKGRMVGFELFLDKIPPKKGKPGTAKPLLKPSPFQPVKRDFAFVVDVDVSAEKLVKAVRGADKALISGVTLFDVYVGDNVPEGKKSLAVDVTLQPTERTLTDEDIEGVSEKIVALVAKNLGGELRG